MGRGYEKLFEAWELAIVKKLINDFRKTWASLGQEEVDDLLQECLSHWFYARQEYDAQREASVKTFLAKTIRNKLMDLVRERESDKRKVSHLAIPIEELQGEDETRSGSELIDAILAAQTDVDPSHSATQLRMDLAKALVKLTNRQRLVCELLGTRGLTVTEASKELQLPRSVIYDELKRIKAVFLRAGLGDYFNI